MREIKFRGKRVDNGKWVYGYYFSAVTGFCLSNGTMPGVDGEPKILHYIKDFDGEDIRVIPETVGQYTGLKDENGAEIYEGDIIQMPHIKSEGYVLDEKGMWKSEVVCGKDGRWQSHNGIGFRLACGVEVVGNIHDNPELLEGGNPDESR